MAKRKDQPGRPSIEDLIKRYESDPENVPEDDHLEVGAIPGDAGQRAKDKVQIRDRFRLGASRICILQIWDKIEEWAGRPGVSSLARRLKVSREHVYRYRRGEMTIQILVAILSEIPWEYSDLGEMPSLYERAVTAYREAICWVKTGKPLVLSNNGVPVFNKSAISEIDLITVLVTVSSPRYLNLLSERLPTDDDWRGVAMGVQPLITERLGLAKDAIALSGKDLRRIMAEWSEIVIACVEAVAYRWMSKIG